MINSSVFDIVIGLVFIYLLYSLLASIIQEIIASNFGFRAKILERAIFRMLEDENKFSKFQSISFLFKKTGNGGKPDSSSFAFYNHPLIKFLGENKTHSKPAYINKETFSKVVIDLLRGDQVKPGDDIKSLIQKALDESKINWGTARICDETVSYLRSIWADAEGDVVKFKKHLENWFDATMERASGWYKRHTQFILFFVGLAIAILFNVDTITIVDKLEKDPKLREQVVQQADAFVKAHPDLDKELADRKASFREFQSRQKKAGSLSADSAQNTTSEDSLELAEYLSLKSHRDTLLNRADVLIRTDMKKVDDVLGMGLNSYECLSCDWGCLFKSLLGWMITAIALSLGAPFWFDMLNKLMKMRGSMTSSSADQKQKS